MTWPAAVPALITHLNTAAAAAGDPVRAYGGVPDPRPGRFLRLVDAGGRVTSPAHREVRVVIEAWAGSDAAAERLADLAHGWLTDATTPAGVVRPGAAGWLAAPYSSPDPTTSTPRYIQTVVLTQRKER